MSELMSSPLGPCSADQNESHLSIRVEPREWKPADNNAVRVAQTELTIVQICGLALVTDYYFLFFGVCVGVGGLLF